MFDLLIYLLFMSEKYIFFEKNLVNPKKSSTFAAGFENELSS